eukprot:TRINITY_DN75475_c0_g1_i1.p1 TRINITY_DN75475_c0_g1~~TRINITY_DN75475_c0_g1_i1.p1  ORF type:complete len:379 (+),score=92.20 TRINITY_DN75475_c0_g1_i1:83-1219(+)
MVERLSMRASARQSQLKQDSADLDETEEERKLRLLVRDTVQESLAQLRAATTKEMAELRQELERTREEYGHEIASLRAQLLEMTSGTDVAADGDAANAGSPAALRSAPAPPPVKAHGRHNVAGTIRTGDQSAFNDSNEERMRKMDQAPGSPTATFNPGTVMFTNAVCSRNLREIVRTCTKQDETSASRDEMLQQALARSSEAELRVRDESGRTLLHIAASRGLADVCSLLLGAEAFQLVNEVDLQGWTSLHWAALEGHDVTCKAILEHPRFRQVNAVDRVHSWTALHCAAKAGNKESCAALLGNPRFDAVNVRDNDGWTCLHCASAFDHAAIVRLLVGNARFQAVNAIDVLGRSAYDVAGSPDVVRAFTESRPMAVAT